MMRIVSCSHSQRCPCPYTFMCNYNTGNRWVVRKWVRCLFHWKCLRPSFSQAMCKLLCLNSFFCHRVHRSISELYCIPLGQKESDPLLWPALKWWGICLVLNRTSEPFESSVRKTAALCGAEPVDILLLPTGRVVLLPSPSHLPAVQACFLTPSTHQRRCTSCCIALTFNKGQKISAVMVGERIAFCDLSNLLCLSEE